MVHKSICLKSLISTRNVVSLVMLVSFLVLNANMSYGQLFTGPFSTEEEQDEFGRNEDGKKKSYTDCDGYDEYTDSKGINKEDADYDTRAVDLRIIELSNDKNFNSLGFTDEEAEELDCLRAIRTIETNAEKDFLETTNDFVKGLEALQTLNQLDQKYNFR